jgi:hypothetical protein
VQQAVKILEERSPLGGRAQSERGDPSVAAGAASMQAQDGPAISARRKNRPPAKIYDASKQYGFTTFRARVYRRS